MHPLEDCLLYAFVDTAWLDNRPPVEMAHQLCDGGVDLIQLRAKDRSRDNIQRMAEDLLTVTEAAGVGLVVNDHPGIAAEVGAPLAHLGQEDFFDPGHSHVDEVCPPGSMLKIGLSTHAPEQAERAMAAGADYIAIGPVFATPSKPGRPPVTLDYVRWASTNVHRPWFAIGGIDLETLDSVLEAGARRICVVSAILDTPAPAHACRRFKERIVSAR